LHHYRFSEISINFDLYEFMSKNTLSQLINSYVVLLIAFGYFLSLLTYNI